MKSFIISAPKNILPNKIRDIAEFVIYSPYLLFNPLYTENLYSGPFANNEDQDEIPQNARFYQDLHCLLS